MVATFFLRIGTENKYPLTRFDTSLSESAMWRRIVPETAFPHERCTQGAPDNRYSEVLFIYSIGSNQINYDVTSLQV